MREEWKYIDGHESYQVSNLGRVKSFNYKDERILKQTLRGSRANNKYLKVSLNGKPYSVHRLVAAAFLPNPNNLPQVNHKDGNKLNNVVNLDDLYGETTNLEWCDGFYNQQHAVATGLRKYEKGSNRKNCKLRKEDVVYIKENFIYKTHDFGAKGMGRKFNVDKKTIMNIINNKTYTDVNCRYKIFAVSDVHGDYDSLIKALRDAGFNENTYNHKLISLGDQFDRIPNSLNVYNYLKHLEEKGKAIIIKGNHDIMLEEYLNGVSISPWNYMRNGTDETLADFLGQTKPFETWCIFNNIDSPTIDDFGKWIGLARQEINKDYPELVPWLRHLPFYYETKNYIFTHAAIDTSDNNWRESFNWKSIVWDDGSFFGSKIENTDKKVVIGHYGTDDLRELYNLPKGSEPYSILVRNDKKVIAIDTCTVLTKKVNVYVVEDELLEVKDELEI